MIWFLLLFLLSSSLGWAQEQGRELYLSYGCALCHGKNGDGHGINGQKYRPTPTNFHDPRTYFHGLDRDSLRRSIQYGIKEDNSIMPAFEDIPTQEVDKIIDYLQSLQNKGDSSAVNH